jgi:hypothetical protein
VNRRFQFHKSAQFFIRVHNEAVTVAAMRVTNEDCSPARIHQQGRVLEQPEQFKDDYDNDDYSDYIENASVHAGD